MKQQRLYVWRVRYQERRELVPEDGTELRDEWTCPMYTQVLCDGDALDAGAKVRAHLVSLSNDDGTAAEIRVLAVRPVAAVNLE